MIAHPGTRGDLPPGWRVEAHDLLPSTSTLLAARAADGAAEGLAILAGQQAAGRGRDGRPWVSPPGNLYLSVLLRPDLAPRDAPQYSLLAAVALAEAAAAVVPDPAALRLKWPNDLLRHGAKCAGILTETALAPDGRVGQVILGIGVNLAAAPALPDRPTTTLGSDLAPEAFAPILLARIAAWHARHAAEGFAPVRAAWLAHGPAPGDPLLLRGAPQPGRFAGLAEDGGLLLDMDGTRRRIVAGEVLVAGEG